MCFWLGVLDKANNSLRYLHVSCDKRLFYCVTWCFVQQRAAVVFICRHSNTCTNFRVTKVWWLFDVHMDRKKWWQFVVEKCEEWTDGRIAMRGKNNGWSCCCLSLVIWRYIAFYLVSYDIALLSYANTTILCSVMVSLLDVKKYKCWLNLMWYSTLYDTNESTCTERLLVKITHVTDDVCEGKTDGWTKTPQYARFYSKLIDKVMWYKQRWCIVKYIIYLFIESWESCVL